MLKERNTVSGNVTTDQDTISAAQVDAVAWAAVNSRQKGRKWWKQSCVRAGGLACLGLALSGAPVFAASTTVTVLGTSGPWQFDSSALNSSYQYGYDDETSPTTLTAANGFSFAAGKSFTISYVSGGVSIGAGQPYTDAIGLTTLDSGGIDGPIDGNPYINPDYQPNPPPDPNYEYAPSLFVNPSQYPAYDGELIGTFATAGGEIVGTPFIVGDQYSVAVPAGATQLQLGVNDVGFSDNSGAWQIQISQVPEPGAGAPVALGSLGLLARRLRRA